MALENDYCMCWNQMGKWNSFPLKTKPNLYFLCRCRYLLKFSRTNYPQTWNTLNHELKDFQWKSKLIFALLCLLCLGNETYMLFLKAWISMSFMAAATLQSANVIITGSVLCPMQVHNCWAYQLGPLISVISLAVGNSGLIWADGLQPTRPLRPFTLPISLWAC